MVEYKYDAWGNHVAYALNATLGKMVKCDNKTAEEKPDALYLELSQINPFRYRGYYYDTETGLYFLKTRYYDPEVGRFITIDDLSYLDPDTINGLNLYAYCGNNPVMAVDPNGNAWWHWLIGALVIVAAAVLTVVTAGGFAAAGTAVLSVFTATMAPTAASAVFAGAFVGSLAIGAIGTVVGGFSGGNGWSWENASQGFMIGSIVGAVVGGAWGGAHFGLQSAGKMPIKVGINKISPNPLDEFVTHGPKDGQITNYVRSIGRTGDYGHISVTKLDNGLFQVADGHHRLEALRKLGYKFIKVFLTK